MRPLRALRDDLHELLDGATTNPALVGLIDALCASDRPESTIVRKRSPKVQALLRDLGDGTIAVTHEGLDTVPGKATEHLRALLQHHGLLPQRDPYLPRFEQWIDAKLDGLPEEVRQPVQHFATWHHLRRIRAKAAAGAATRLRAGEEVASKRRGHHPASVGQDESVAQPGSVARLDPRAPHRHQ